MIELKVLTNTYKEMMIDNEVHEIIDKKDIVIRKLVEVEDIKSIQEVLTERGKPYKTRCIVYIHNEGYMNVKHRYEELKQIKNGGTKTIGYTHS